MWSGADAYAAASGTLDFYMKPALKKRFCLLSSSPVENILCLTWRTQALWEAEAMQKVKGDLPSSLFTQISQTQTSQNSFHLPEELFAGNKWVFRPPYIVSLK